MSDILGALAITIVGGCVLTLMIRHARRLDRLEARYVSYLKTAHPEIAIVKKKGGRYFVRIEGKVYLSSVLDFYWAYRQNPSAWDQIVDDYLSSLPRMRKAEPG